MSYLLFLKSFLNEKGHIKESSLIKVGMILKGYPYGQYLFAHKESIYRFNEDQIFIMKEIVNHYFENDDEIKDFSDFYDFFSEKEHTLDFILGKIYDDTLYVFDFHSISPNPSTSILIKKIMKQFKLKFVERSNFEGDSIVEYIEDNKIHNLPEYLYHGTSIKYADKIMRFGLKPGESKSNFPHVIEKYDNLIFLGPLQKAVFHAVTTSAITDTDPIIFRVKIPDQNKLYPDYDIDRFFEQKYYSFKLKEMETKSEGDSFSKSREAGFFAYIGRIPANNIVEILLAPNPEDIESITSNDFISISREQLALYLRTKEDIGIGYLSELDYNLNHDDDDDDDDDDMENNASDVIQKSYSDLLNELKWLGPAVTTKLMLDGNTRQCGHTADYVTYYLQEKGFIARNDIGAGKYSSHFDLAVYTRDKGWISVDPTYIQFHAPNNLEHALDIAEIEIEFDRDSISDDKLTEIFDKYFKKTIDWTVDSIKEGISAFEISELKNITSDIENTKYQPPSSYFYIDSYSSWEDFWKKYKNIANKILSGDKEPLEKIFRRMRPEYDYWLNNVLLKMRILENKE
jgi:hypothetical protein